MKNKPQGLLIFCGILLGLLAAELGARILIPANRINRYVFDPVLGHARPRAQRGHYSTSEFDTFLQFNSLGFRDSERQQKKDPGVFRIAVLGDSYVEGAHVQSDELMTANLDIIIN
jgi:hypothetical protein